MVGNVIQIVTEIIIFAFYRRHRDRGSRARGTHTENSDIDRNLLQFRLI